MVEFCPPESRAMREKRRPGAYKKKRRNSKKKSGEQKGEKTLKLKLGHGSIKSP